MNKPSIAPLVVCAFNRAAVLQRTLSALADNELAPVTPLYIFIDGPRANVDDDRTKVDEVIKVARNIAGFKSVSITVSDTNKGLAASIIGAATAILNDHQRVIMVEDDLYCSKSFLRYMNTMLDRFEHDQRVMQVSGYGCRITPPSDYHYDVYLNRRAHSWSWATWADRWNTVDWQVSDFDQLASNKKAIKAFNRYGSDLFGMLKRWKTGANNSWYIRFNYSMHKQQRYAVCPVRSLVRNDGFGDDATNCAAYNRYKVDFEDEHHGDFSLPNQTPSLQPREDIIRDAVKYWSWTYRIYGYIMTKLK